VIPPRIRYYEFNGVPCAHVCGLGVFNCGRRRERRMNRALREVHEEENSVFHTEFHTGGFIRLSERRWHQLLIQGTN